MYRLELYNYYRLGSRFPTNGWYVARCVPEPENKETGGCRRVETIADFYTNEDAARAAVGALNKLEGYSSE